MKKRGGRRWAHSELAETESASTGRSQRWRGCNAPFKRLTPRSENQSKIKHILEYNTVNSSVKAREILHGTELYLSQTLIDFLIKRKGKLSRTRQKTPQNWGGVSICESRTQAAMNAEKFKSGRRKNSWKVRHSGLECSVEVFTAAQIGSFLSYRVITQAHSIAMTYCFYLLLRYQFKG